tara:strand:- start:34072 stop:34257 length:186 start_codon:yes stop_codon:yes gene_type:complete
LTDKGFSLAALFVVCYAVFRELHGWLVIDCFDGFIKPVWLKPEILTMLGHLFESRILRDEG